MKLRTIYVDNFNKKTLNILPPPLTLMTPLMFLPN